MDLGAVGGASNLQLPSNGDLTFGINDSGQVVFFGRTTPSNPSSDVHLKLRLPVTMFNLSAGIHDLHPLMDPPLPSGFVHSVGTDINNDGKIVGLAGEEISNVGDHAEAWLFKVDQTFLQGSAPHIPNESIHPSSIVVASETESTGCFSVAHGITNSSPPAIAGTVMRSKCGDDCDRLNPLVGFTYELGGSYVARQVSSGSRDSFTLSVNDASPRLAVGRDELTINPMGLCEEGVGQSNCDNFDNDNDGLQWSGTSTTPTVLMELGAGSGDQGITSARDVHADGSAVGLSQIPFGQQCRPQAVYWDANNGVTSLNSVYTSPDNAARAEAIREIGTSDDLRVVGGDTDSQRGILWLRLSDDWCAYDLNDITWKPSGTDQNDGYFVILAHDVNVHGHIVGYGSAPSGVEHAYLLTCAADYNGDFLIDGSDMGILLALWNCSGCSEDLDGDGAVGPADLGLLLASWWDEDEGSPCDVALPTSCSSGFARAGSEEELEGGGMTLEEAILSLGFDDADALATWSLTASPSELNGVGITLAMLIGGW
ncbi:MAG: hypothetical protein U0575_13955 [Phycisphaerales bacterium]